MQLRHRVIRGSILEAVGFGGSSALRLAGNLILTRLMYPEAFGIATLASIVFMGLLMLSDAGLAQVVIQSRRATDRRFLDTVWTLQVVRGFGLAVICVAIAKPYAWLYDEPVLSSVLLVTAGQLAISGLHSTSLFLLRRDLRLGWLTAIELSGQALSLLAMITWACISPSLWALVCGGALKSLFDTIVSHLLPNFPRNRFAWDRDTLQDIRQFGRWIFGSSIITFFSNQGDRMVLGALLGPHVLGVYTVAVVLADSSMAVVSRIQTGVLYPAFSSVHRDGGRDSLYRIYLRARLRIDCATMPAIGALAALGPWLVHCLWDDRYLEAGAMLQILAIRAALECIATSWTNCTTAMGFPKYAFARSAIRTPSLFAFMFVGYAAYGIEGLVWAIALAEVPAIAWLLPRLKAMQMLNVPRELLPIPLFCAGLGLGTLIDQVLPR